MTRRLVIPLLALCAAPAAIAQETFTYDGSYVMRSEGKLDPNAVVSVTNPAGTTSVRCTDTEYLEARVVYSIEGTDQGPMEAYGKSVGLAAWGTGPKGGVKLAVGSRPSAVKGAKVELVVNAPKQARLTVSSTGDWVQVLGCDGTVTASAGKNGAYVDGPLDGFAVSAGHGDVKVVVTEGGKIAANSSATANDGKATVVLPLASDLKIDARGANVSVTHNVMGSVAPQAVVGTIGAGGPALTIKASGDVVVQTP